MKRNNKSRASAAGWRKLAGTQIFLYIATCLIGQTRALSSSSLSSCERIGFQLCSKINYNFTKMPNFFGDPTQIEANDRSKLYFQLVNSKCSPYIHAYICELLTPVCSNDPTMRKFDIYPCRSFCLQIKSDCHSEIMEVKHKLSLKNDNSDLTFLQSFDCERLPYEYNGGNGTNSGPCHEVTPTEKYQNSQQLEARQQQHHHHQPVLPDDNENNPYRPFDPTLAQMPYITDTSRIDTSLIRPTLPNSFNDPADLTPPLRQPPRHFINPEQPSEREQSRQNQQQASNFLSQVSGAGQSIKRVIFKYLNELTVGAVMMIMFLMVALNLKRLTRFKNYLSLSASSSANSSSSGGSSSSTGHQKHFNGPLIAGYPPLSSCSVTGGAQISPSSSARSLIVYSGSGKQPACHKLLPAVPINESIAASTASSIPKLCDDLDRRKTRINLNNNNLNRSLLREQTGSRYPPGSVCSPARGSGKQHYLHNSQNSDKQQLFNTLDSHSTNQYDYIDYPEHPKPNARSNQQLANQHQQQLYTNIRLSSPNNQVWLFPSGVSIPFRQ